MNKSGLIERISQKTNLPKKEAETLVETVFGMMYETLGRHDRIEIRGFATWFVKAYNPYTGRNPKTGEKVSVEDKFLPFFKAGKELKQEVNNQNKPISH